MYVYDIFVTYIYIYGCIHIHTYMCHLFACIYTDKSMYVSAYDYTYNIYRYKDIYTYILRHKCICTYTHIDVSICTYETIRVYM